MLTGIGLNTVASLTAIALWALAPKAGGPMSCLPGEAAVAVSPRPAQPVLLPRRSPLRLAQGTAAPPGNEGSVEAPALVDRVSQNRGGGAAASAAVTALGERLHLDPQALALQLGDEHGEIPKLWAERLERGFKASEALARRLNLDESRTQSLVALTTYYVFSVIREEKAAPGGVDLARRDALSDSLLNDVRVTCGEDTAAAAKSELTDL
jgi:hypothetical protein